jgi:hypothetical protein
VKGAIQSMEINFTKEQYENLIKLVYLGNWMINAIRTDDRIEKFYDLEQYIYSYFKDFGLHEYIEYDKELKKFFPTEELMEEELEEYIDDYNDYNFWDELTFRLARRDLLKKYGENEVEKMSLEERMKKEVPFLEKYGEEFEKYGVERLGIED